MHTQVNVAGVLSCPKPYKYHLKIAPGKKFKTLIYRSPSPPSLYWFSNLTMMGVLLYCFRHANLTADRFLMVYDLRVMRAMAPIQVIIDPMFLRFIHTCPNKMVITSQVLNAYACVY